MTQRYDVSAILRRAAELEIELSMDGDHLKIRAKNGTVTPHILSVLKAHKQALLDYLKAEQNLVGEPEAPLCATCLDEGREREALSYDYQGIMYCAEHMPDEGKRAQSPLDDPVVKKAIALFSPCHVRAYPVGTCTIEMAAQETIQRLRAQAEEEKQRIEAARRKRRKRLSSRISKQGDNHA
jgi:hypothetical protein